MEDWRERLRKRIYELNWRAVDLSAQSDIHVESIRKYLNPNHYIKNPRGQNLEKLALATGLNVLWLKDGIGSKLDITNDKFRHKTPNAHFDIDNHDLYNVIYAKNLPIMWQSSQGVAGVYNTLRENDIPDYALRPPYLINDKAFAVIVSGKTMEPEFYDKDVVYIDPNIELTADRSVFVQLKDGSGYLYVFKEKLEKNWVFYNRDKPFMTITLPLDEVVNVSKVVGKQAIS